ncbi:hypothetical protein EV122DRAFT_289339 [Schizophyllum commune]
MYPLSRLMLTVASISHVCRRWRAITEYDKQLWAPVCIKLDYYDIMALSEPLTSEQLLPFKNAVRAYLAKSDPLPFAIDLQGPCLALDFHGQRKLCILPEGDFFDHLARRCHRARLCTTSINHVNYLFRVARRSLSARVEMESLESLELVENRKHPNEMYLHKADFFTRNAPRLRSWKQHVVDLTSAGHRGAIVHAPGRTLECLEASWTEWRLAGAALPRWVNLKGLVIAICQPYDPWRDFNLKPVTLSQLESLTVAATPAHAANGASGDISVASSAGSRGRVSKSTARQRTRGGIESKAIAQDDSGASLKSTERNTSTDLKSRRARANRKDKHVEPSRRSARIFARMNGPIHRLPTELLSEIFLHLRELLIPDYRYPNPTPALDSTITRVCRSWRHVAHGTPLLEPAEYLRRYLPLTGTCPLHVNLCRTMSSRDQPGIEQLRDHSHRMRSLEVTASFEEFTAMQPFASPDLQSAFIMTLSEKPLGTVTPLAFLDDVSRLSDLCPNFQFVKVQAISVPPLESLTELTLYLCFGVSNVRGILQQCCRTLRKLKVSVGVCDTRPAPAEALDLPSLESLDLDCNDGPVLQMISAPNLEKLKLYGPAPDIPALLLAYLTRVPASAANLRLLHIDTVHTEDWDEATVPGILLECFAKMEGLEIIGFNVFPDEMEMEIFGPLTKNLEEGALPLLPNLKVALFGRRSFSWNIVYTEAYNAFVESRKSAQLIGGAVVPAAQISRKHRDIWEIDIGQI